MQKTGGSKIFQTEILLKVSKPIGKAWPLSTLNTNSFLSSMCGAALVYPSYTQDQCIWLGFLKLIVNIFCEYAHIVVIISLLCSDYA